MFWKNWPYWLKGAILVFVLHLLFLLLVFPCKAVCSGWDCLNCAIYAFPLDIFVMNLLSFKVWPIQQTYQLIILELVLTILLGAFLGFVYNKIKNNIIKKYN